VAEQREAEVVGGGVVEVEQLIVDPAGVVLGALQVERVVQEQVGEGRVVQRRIAGDVLEPLDVAGQRLAGERQVLVVVAEAGGRLELGQLVQQQPGLDVAAGGVDPGDALVGVGVDVDRARQVGRGQLGREGR
jgi:hypothetical protein